MLAFLQTNTPIVIFNQIVVTLLTVCFLYQVVFFVIGALRGEVAPPKAKKLHRYAFFIAAHNEEAVIANLVRSIKDQDYPSELIEVFVVADACTDNTAQLAREAGAIVYERNDLARKGKSWVMDYGFDRILNEYPDTFEGYFIFDADNVISRDYVSKMNDAFDQGFHVVTSYRNSKNFGSSWISAANATWYLREARFLNNARNICKTSCAVSGSGYLISASVIEGMHGWQFHTLTEDIQFTTFCAIHGIRIGYAPAEFFDEQPVTFKASWKQRMRWTKGFYQVFFTYGKHLVKSTFRYHRFAAYDMFMTIAPGMLLSLISMLANATFLIVGGLSHGFLGYRNRDAGVRRLAHHDLRDDVPDLLYPGATHDHLRVQAYSLCAKVAFGDQPVYLPDLYVQLYPHHGGCSVPKGRLGPDAARRERYP